MVITLLRWLSFAFSLSVISVYCKGGSLLLGDAKRSFDTTGKLEYFIFAILMGLLGLTIIISQLLICLGLITPINSLEKDGIILLGSGSTMIGISAAYWIRFRFLKSYRSGNIEIQENHQIVKEGPYRLVRHPIYSTTLLMYIGAALAFAIWWNWIACGLMIVGYIWLTTYVDNYLQENLPEYKKYQQETRCKLIPKIW